MFVFKTLKIFIFIIDISNLNANDLKKDPNPKIWEIQDGFFGGPTIVLFEMFWKSLYHHHSVTPLNFCFSVKKSRDFRNGDFCFDLNNYLSSYIMVPLCAPKSFSAKKWKRVTSRSQQYYVDIVTVTKTELGNVCPVWGIFSLTRRYRSDVCDSLTYLLTDC